jgi:hypothetical protein
MMLAPMMLLGFCCAIIGLAPTAFTGLIQRGVMVWEPGLQGPETIISRLWLSWLSVFAVALVLVLLVGAYAMGRLRRHQSIRAAGTWDCGYVRSTARIQYTGTSFGQMLTDLFGWVLLPCKVMVRLRGFFPTQAEFGSEVPDAVLDRALVPAFSIAERVLNWARPIQRGTVQLYLVYLLLALLALLPLSAW